MARQLRIEFSGAYYHILSRGNNRCDIFRSDEDRHDFLNLLADLTERFAIDIFAYVLMNNHYHLLVRTLKSNLSRAMQWLGTGYTRRYNLRNSQGGHLFQGRFKSIIVEDDTYLMRLSCYIHRNPLRAGIVSRLADYQWSSYLYYAYEKLPPAWLRTDLILSQFISTKDRHESYRNKVQRYADEKQRIWEDVKFGFIYGSQSFLDHIKDTYLSDGPDGELPQLNRLLNAAPPEELIEKAANLLNCDIDFFREAGRLLGENRDKRDVILYLLWETGRYGNQRIGELMGLKYSSVSRRIHHVKSRLKSVKNSDVKKIYDAIKARIKV
jgi:putative transposase